MVTCLAIRPLSKMVYVLSVLLFLAGCTGPALQTPSPTYARTYTHYVPKPGSLFKLEFYYPTAWALGERSHDDSLDSIYITEFYKTPVPTGVYLDPPDPLGPIVLIDVQRVNPATFSLDHEIESYLAMPRGRPYKQIIGDRSADIAGHVARHVTIRNAPIPVGPLRKAMIQEEIFLLVEDRYYFISLSLPEEERQGAFGQGFDQLVRSIRLLD